MTLTEASSQFGKFPCFSSKLEPQASDHITLIRQNIKLHNSASNCLLKNCNGQFFIEKFQVHSNGWKAQNFLIPLAPNMHCLPHYKHTSNQWSSCCNNRPTLTYHYHQSPQFTCIRVHSCCCTFFGFPQIYNDTEPLLQYQKEQFHCCKNHLCPPMHPSFQPNSWHPLIFLLSSYLIVFLEFMSISPKKE